MEWFLSQNQCFLKKLITIVREGWRMEELLELIESEFKMKWKLGSAAKLCYFCLNLIWLCLNFELSKVINNLHLYFLWLNATCRLLEWVVLASYLVSSFWFLFIVCKLQLWRNEEWVLVFFYFNYLTQCHYLWRVLRDSLLLEAFKSRKAQIKKKPN